MIRDLEAEGVLKANSKSVGAGEFSMFTVMVDLQHRLKKVEADLIKANEVIAGLAAKVRCLEAVDRQPLEIKGTWQTGGVDQ